MKTTIYTLTTCSPADGQPICCGVFTTEAAAFAEFDKQMRLEWEVNGPRQYRCGACDHVSDDNFDKCGQCGVPDQSYEEDKPYPPGDPQAAKPLAGHSQNAPQAAHDRIDATRSQIEAETTLSETWGRYSLDIHEIDIDLTRES